MKDTLRKIIAWTGLVFMTAFFCTMVATLIDRNLLWGRITYVSIACLIVGLVLFALIYFDNKERRAKQQAEDEEKARREGNKRKRRENSEKIAAENAAKQSDVTTNEHAPDEPEPAVESASEPEKPDGKNGENGAE